MAVAGVRITIGVVLGIVWMNQAGPTNAAIFPTEGALFACCLNGALDTIFQTALLLPKLRALVLREYRNAYYPISPFLLSMLLCHMLAHTINIFCLAVPVYLLVGLRPEISRFLLFFCVLITQVRTISPVASARHCSCATDDAPQRASLGLWCKGGWSSTWLWRDRFGSEWPLVRPSERTRTPSRKRSRGWRRRSFPCFCSRGI
eukprot:COSAG01_NODE_2397_length_7771_cov_12.578076_5_plen_204_part_00